MLIDCETCAVRDIACDDCVVGVLLAGPGSDETLNTAERAAIGVLARSGLVPPLRLVEKADSASLDGNVEPPPGQARRPVEGTFDEPTYRPIQDAESA